MHAALLRFFFQNIAPNVYLLSFIYRIIVYYLYTTSQTVISNCEICSIEQRNHDEPPLEIPCSSCCLVGDIGTSSHSLKNSQRNVSQAVELIDYDNSDDNNKRPAGITCSICLECFGVGNKISWSRDNEECNHPFHHDCLMKWLLQHNDCPICRQPIVCDEFDRVKELLKRHASNDDNDGRSSSNNNDPIIGKGDVETGNSTNGSSDDAIFIWCVIHGPLLLHDKSSSSRPKITGSHGDDPLSTTVAPHVVCHTKIRDQPSLGECIYRLEALEHGEIDKQ